MDREDEKLSFWMDRALALARQAAENDEVPVGAVLVYEGQLLAQGRNRREERHSATAHAEIVALEAYSRQSGQWRLPAGAVLFTTAEPCLMCAGAMLWARVSQIYYGCQDPRNAGLRNLMPWIESGKFDHRFSAEGGLLADQCSEVMSDFFRRKRAAVISRPGEMPRE